MLSCPASGTFSVSVFPVREIKVAVARSIAASEPKTRSLMPLNLGGSKKMWLKVKAEVVREFVDDGVIVGDGAAGWIVLEKVNSAGAEGADRRRARYPDHQVDDVAGLLDDGIAGDGAVEEPGRIVREVGGVAVALEENDFADAAGFECISPRHCGWDHGEAGSRLDRCLLRSWRP